MTGFFKAQLKLKFAPRLRADGFKGSGLTFRRLTGPVVQVIHLQGARAGDSCCVEMGTHLLFLPTVLEDDVDPKLIAVTACEFRERLVPRGQDDQWWPYGTTCDDAARSVDDLLATYASVGTDQLERHRSFPGEFSRITPEMVRSANLSVFPGKTTVARAALAMARISRHLSNFEQARRFIEVGLDDLNRLPNVGMGVRRQLLDVQRALNGAG